MQRGVKLTSPDRKKLAGTVNTTRDRTVVSIVTDTSSIPKPPAWLTEPARKIWDADIAHIIACGATAVDSSMVALYCTTMADFVASVAAGEPANAAFRSELRKQSEMLGLAGAKSRLARIGAPEPAKKSPFAPLK